MTSEDKCGSTDTTTGEPCQRPAGWGRDTNRGHCQDHKEPGRDPKLTQARQEKIAGAIEEGKSIASACRMAGIDRTTFYNWMGRGEDEKETVYSEFFNRITRARGHGEDQYFTTIFELAKQEGDLATLMSMLKQRYPESWGDVKRGEQAGGVIVNLGDEEEYEIDPETLELQDN